MAHPDSCSPHSQTHTHTHTYTHTHTHTHTHTQTRTHKHTHTHKSHRQSHKHRHKESDPSLHRPKNFSIKTVYSNSIVIMGFYCSSIVNFGLPRASIAWLRASLCFKRASRGYHLLGSHSYTSTICFCRKPPEACLKQREAHVVIIEAWSSLTVNNRNTIEARNLNRVMICELYFC